MAEMVKATLNGRYEIILPKHRADRPEWYTEKGWEKERLNALHDEIKNQLADGQLPNVYYVGAEEGEMCALCSIWGADVLMVEPNERVMPNIKAIWQANNLKSATVLCGFFGNKDDGYMIPMKVEDITGEVIHDHGFKELRDPGDIPIRKIDTVVNWDIGFKPPTIITMDVEGSEWEVLQGAEETIDKHHPTIFLSLHPEFLINQYNKYSYEVRRWLIDKGYEETLLDYQHEAHFLYRTKNET